MHDTGVDVRGVEIQATLECTEDGLEFFGRCPPARVEGETLCGELT